MTSNPVMLLPDSVPLDSVTSSDDVGLVIASTEKSRRHLLAPPNMMSLRQPSVSKLRKTSVTKSGLPEFPIQQAEPNQDQLNGEPPAAPVASTSKVPKAPKPTPQPTEQAEADSIPYSTLISASVNSGVANAPLPSTARTLRSDIGSLSSHKVRRPSSSSTVQQSSPEPPPPLMYSRNLKPPPKADLTNFVIASSSPSSLNANSSANRKPPMKSAMKQPSAQNLSPPRPSSNNPAASPSMSRTSSMDTPVSPISSAPPTGSPQVSPTKSALKPKSWAELLRTQNTPLPQKRVSIALPSDHMSLSSASDIQPLSYVKIASSNGKPQTNGYTKDAPQHPGERSLADILRGVDHQYSAPLLVPRGIINQGNMCFENTILQVLVFCAPFYNLIRLVGQNTMQDFTGRTRLMDAMIHFLNEFKIQGGHDGMEWTEPFIPDHVYEALRSNKRFEAMQRGMQEDAQEFLGFFLDELHEELLLLTSKQPPQANGISQNEGDGWLEVGSKGRTATTRTAEQKESAITKIFGGTQRSVLRAPGQKDSAIVEPFLTLGLDIQSRNIESIEDALANLTQPETVSDYIVRGGIKVEATKQLFLETLPPILVLHLKRFSYNNVGGTIKNHKVVSYSTELEISPSILASSKRSKKPIKYRLQAVVYHHGRSATGGHYTAAIRQQNSQWINVDDTHISYVQATDVAVDRLKEVLRLSLPSAVERDGLPDRSAYLLLYQKVPS